MKLRVRKSFCHFGEGDASTTADIGSFRPGLKFTNYPIETWQHSRNQGKTIPVTKDPLDAMCAFRSTRVVVQTDSGAKRLRQPFYYSHTLRQITKNTDGKLRAVVIG